MARQNQGRAGDFTGNQKIALAKEFAEEQALAAETMGLATAEKAEKDKEPVVLQSNEELAPVVDTSPTDVVSVTDVDISEDKVTFRVNETLEQVTIGYGNNFDFEEGREYTAARYIRDHLEEKGLIWH